MALSWIFNSPSVRKLGRAWSRIWTKGAQVDLPVWQRPMAMLYSLGFFTIVLVGEIYSALTRSFEPLPEIGAQEPA